MTARTLEILFHALLIAVLLTGLICMLSGCAGQTKMEAVVTPEVLRNLLREARIGTVEYRGLGAIEILAICVGGSAIAFSILYPVGSVLKDWIRAKIQKRKT